MKLFQYFFLLIFIFLSVSTHAATIQNGNFQSGDFTGWSLDTDGGFIGAAPDFQLINSAGNYSARIEADYWSVPGDSLSTPHDNVFFANTLFQGLELATSTGQNLVLSFEWEFSGEKSISDENFLVALGDGSGSFFNVDGDLGFLFNPLHYGTGTYTGFLDSSFSNAASWTLEFQLNTGSDAYGSYLSIDNVSLNAVPVPSAIFLLSSGIFALIAIYHRKV